MAEIVGEYKVKVDKAVSDLDAAAKSWQKVEYANNKANKTATDGFLKGSDGAKRLNAELQRQPKTLAELELKLKRLKELLRDDTEIGTKGFKKVTAEIKNTEKAIDKANGKLEETGKQGNGMMSIFKKLGGVLLAVFAVDKIVSYGKEAIELAAKAEGIRTAFSKLDSPNLLANLRKATRGAVTDVELMRQAVRANNFQVPLEKLGTFFEFATKRSIETGESVDYLVSSIIDGIGRKSTLVLDNLGISATQLQDEIKKTGDFGQAAANIIEKSLSETGDVADTTAVKMAQLSTATENLKTALGALVAEQARPVITFLTNVSKAIEDDITELARFTENIRSQSSYKLLGTQAEEAAKLVELEKEATEAAGKVRDAEFRKLLAKVDAQRKVVDAIELELKSRIDNSVEIEITTDLIDKEIAAYKARVAVTEKTIVSFNSLNAELKALQEELNSAELGSSAFFNILDKLDAKIKQLTEADALTKLADALKVDDEVDGVSDSEFQHIKMISQADYDLYQEKKKNREEFDSWLDAKNEEWLAKQLELLDKETEARKISKQEQIQIVQGYSSQVSNIIGSISQIQANAFAYEQQELERQLEQGIISREQYERKRSELAQKQAQSAKDAQLFQAIISTAQATVAALGSVPFSPANIALAALVGAAGAAQIAAIASTPVPKFATGVIGLKGKGTQTSDEIPAMLSVNESVMTGAETTKYKEELWAMRKGTFDQLIMSKYVKPMIDESLFNGFADLGKSADLNGLTANLKDHNIIAAMDRNRQSTTFGLNLVANKLDKLGKANTRTGW